SSDSAPSSRIARLPPFAGSPGNRRLSRSGLSASIGAKNMRHYIMFALAALTLSCGKKENGGDATSAKDPVALGQELFEGKGNCFACHQADRKIIAPSIIDIAKIYKEKNGDMVSFLRGESDPLVDPSQYEITKTNFSMTKSMTDDELKALEAYMYSFLI